MELRDYLRIARRRWQLIAGCVVVVVAIAAAVTLEMTPEYQSQAQLFVSTPADNSVSTAYQGGLFSAQQVTSYAELVGSRALSRRVIADLGLEHSSPAAMSEQVSASVVPDTVLISVTATDPSPKRAQAIAQATAEELSGAVRRLETPPGKKRAPIKASVSDHASLPTSPVSPNPLGNVGLGILLGLLLGFGLAVLRELLDTSVKTAEDVDEVAHAPVLGTIAFDSAASRRPLVTDLDTHAPRIEAFRVLRTNMQFIDVDAKNRVYVVSSSVPTEGKTTTATNLAITLAQAGERVLLLEGDLRRPKMADNLGLEAAVGLTTVLLGRIGVHEATQHPLAAPELSVLTSGGLPPNPSELLQSNAMVELLHELRNDYDVIIIDAPPLLPVTDAALLAARSDGALLVVRHSKTTRDQLSHTIGRLDAVGAKTLGVVLNMIPRRRTDDDYGYGYGYAPRAASGKAGHRRSRRGEADDARDEAFVEEALRKG